MVRYNLKIIFANKFIWFLLGALAFYVGLILIYVFTEDISRLKISTEYLFSVESSLFSTLPYLASRTTRMQEQLKYSSEFQITGIRYGW